MWQLVLAWAGLRTTATTAACSTAFGSLHRSVAATPALLARALLVDHGLIGAVSNLYGSSAGHHHERHAVRSDADIAATLRNLLVLSAPSGPGAAAAAAAAATAAASAATAAVAAVVAAEATAVAADSTAAIAAGVAKRLEPLLHPSTAPAVALSKVWGSGGRVNPSGVGPQLLGGLLCAAAAAGHALVVATALALGAGERDRALLAACAAGRSRVVRLLLAGGADPNATEPFGACALYEAARHGNRDIVEILLDAGARVDGAVTVTTANPPYDGRLMASLALPLPTGARRTQVGGAGAGVGTTAPVACSWLCWPVRGTDGDGDVGAGPRGAAADVTRKDPLPLRVPVPLAAAATPAPAPAFPIVQRCFNDTGGAADADASHARHADDAAPKTPTASAAASAAWSDEDDDEDEDDLSNGMSVLRTPIRRTVQLQLQPPPPPPPPLPRRKLPLPLPPNPAALPRVPPLTSPPAMPLPPALMAVLLGNRGSQPRGGPSPLLAACRGGHAATAALLLRRGARADTSSGAELLAATNPQVVDELIAAVPGLAVHLSPALVAAAAASRVDVVSALLRHGADPTFRGGSALQEAAFQGHVEILQLLLDAGGTRLRESGALHAALNWARCFGRMAVLELLAPSE